MAKVLKRIENEVEQQYGLRPHVRDLKPMDGVEYCLLPESHPLHRLPQMRACLRGENNQSRNPEIQYIRVLRLPNGSLDIEKAEHNYNPESVPGKRLFLHARPMPAVQESAVRESLPRPRHLAGDRRHHGD